MKNVTEYIREHLYEICGMRNIQALDECVAEQCAWSSGFMKLMIHRIAYGRYRYGKQDTTVRKNYNYTKSAIDRLMAYQATGNTEHLVDVANFCMLEFVYGQHPMKHFTAIDDGEHAHEHN